VDDGQNQFKRAKGPGDWLPPDESYHWEYARQWGFLRNKYELALGAQDIGVIEQTLKSCP